MSDIVSYEVYAYQNGDWDLMARYSSEQRGEALDYAKTIERKEGRPVKVLREGYDINTKSFRDTLVYLSDLSKIRPKKAIDFTKKTSDVEISAPPPPSPMGSVLESITKLFVALLFSIVVSGLLTTATLHAAESFNLLPHHISQQFILSLFTFFFLLTSIPTASSWVDWSVFMEEDKTPLVKEPVEKEEELPDKFTLEDLYSLKKDATKTAEEEKAEEEEERAGLPFFIRILYDFIDLFNALTGKTALPKSVLRKRRKSLRQKEADKLLEQHLEEEEETEAEEPEKEETETEAESEPEIKTETPQETNEVAEFQKESAEENETEEKEEAPIVIPPDLEKSYLKITAFLAVVLRTLQSKNTAFNTYTRFGLELFLAGACEKLCQQDRLSKQEHKLILAKLLTLLGRPTSLANIFYQKLSEYMLEPKYLPMIEAGSEGMNTYLLTPSSPEIVSFVAEAVDNWKNPHQKDKVSAGICTVMFTDMVSSTHLTQLLGDDIAQRMVRTHNTIVRNTLKSHGGTEVKHTGDGIMASFLWASNAVEAAIAIQEAVEEHNKKEKRTSPLEIRIGLNAGEPIVEENDLFGQTVQLASRICGQAHANEIYVSSVVKELSSGKKHTFKPLGSFSLKGIDEPQTLYEVVWKEPSAEQEEEEKEKELSKVLPEF